jgi:hypothetical protein
LAAARVNRYSNEGSRPLKRRGDVVPFTEGDTTNVVEVVDPVAAGSDSVAVVVVDASVVVVGLDNGVTWPATCGSAVAMK